MQVSRTSGAPVVRHTLVDGSRVPKNQKAVPPSSLKGCRAPFLLLLVRRLSGDDKNLSNAFAASASFVWEDAPAVKVV
jgi:hypothetical protein